MTAKEIKYMGLLKKYFTAGVNRDEAEYVAAMTAALNFDYNAAVTLWEYALVECDAKMFDKEYARVLADVTETVFEKKNASRLAKTIIENTYVCNAIYRWSRTALSRKEPIGYLVTLLAGGKTEDAEEIMKCALKNANCSFGAFLLAVVDRVIIELLKKNAKNPMPKKVSTLILAYADKIKGGEEKALIYQRIRELG